MVGELESLNGLSMGFKADSEQVWTIKTVVRSTLANFLPTQPGSLPFKVIESTNEKVRSTHLSLSKSATCIRLLSMSSVSTSNFLSRK